MIWVKPLALFLNYVGLWVTAILFLLPLRKKQTHIFLKAAGCIAVGTLVRFASGMVMCNQMGHAVWLDLLLCYGAAVLLFWQCGDLSSKAVCYCGVWVVMVHSMTVDIATIPYQMLWNMYPAVWLPVLGIWCGSLAVVGATVARWMPDKRSYHTGPRQLVLALLLGAVFLAITCVYWNFGLGSDVQSGWAIMMLIKFYCITVLYLQHELFQKSAIRQELSMLNHLRLQQKNQYDLAKENISLINRKCHDLKHQIKAMRILFNDEGREKYLQEVEQSVRIYEVLVKTGNEVLDTVLTEKSLYCEANGIQANCVADGRLLDFMDPVDLYTILGNAMDNAIESVKQNNALEQRIIDVLIYAEKHMLVIQVTNPVTQELNFDEDGLPVSTKEQNGYHGFGLKSIRQTVEKYSGFLNLKVDNQIFYLQILLPIKG